MRKKEYDNLKGIMIFFVVVSHLTTLYVSDNEHNIIMCFNVVINSFVMPAFSFVSGVFSKKFIDQVEAKKILKSILIPYILFNFLHWIISSRDIATFFSAQWTMWYLLSLFIWKLLSIPLCKIKHSLFVIVIISLIAGCIENGEIFAITRTIAFFPFYYLGFIIDVEKIDYLRKKISGKYLCIPCIMLLFAIIFISKLYYSGLPAEIVFLRSSYKSMGLDISQGICFRLISLVISLVEVWCFIVLVSEKKTFITTIGENSIIIYLMHSFIISLIRYIWKIQLSELGFLCIIIILASLICLLCGNTLVAKLYKKVMDKVFNAIIIQ